jgi:acetolactate synthase-1/2/3 large subunit
VLTRVVTDYGDRPLRWVDAVKKRYRDELTTEQKMRFLARMGSRAVHFASREND